MDSLDLFSFFPGLSLTNSVLGLHDGSGSNLLPQIHEADWLPLVLSQAFSMLVVNIKRLPQLTDGCPPWLPKVEILAQIGCMRSLRQCNSSIGVPRSENLHDALISFKLQGSYNFHLVMEINCS